MAEVSDARWKASMVFLSRSKHNMRRSAYYGKAQPFFPRPSP